MNFEQIPGAVTTIFVCITCRREGEALDPPEQRSGYRLHEGLARTIKGSQSVEVRPVACLSNCTRGCNVAFASPGKWTFVTGNLDPAIHASDVLAFAGQHRDHAEGLPVWRERPESIRKGVAARVPPLAFGLPAEEGAAP